MLDLPIKIVFIASRMILSSMHTIPLFSANCMHIIIVLKLGSADDELVFNMSKRGVLPIGMKDQAPIVLVNNEI